MIRITETFATREEADTFVANYLRSYHPCGYGTSLSVSATKDGKWLVTGSRYRSCD